MKIESVFVKPIFKILNFIFNNPTKELYEKKIAEYTKLSVGSVHNYMKKLCDMSFLTKEKRGRMNFYRLNVDNEFIKRLKILFFLDSPLINKIRNKTSNKKAEVFLYGSFARGEYVEDSDVDILLICESSVRGKLISELKSIGQNFGKEIKVVAHTRKEWLDIRKLDPAFYERVEKDKIRLV